MPQIFRSFSLYYDNVPDEKDLEKKIMELGKMFALEVFKRPLNKRCTIVPSKFEVMGNFGPKEMVFQLDVSWDE